MPTCESETMRRCLFFFAVYVKLTTGYLQYLNEQKTMLDAKKHCQQLGGHLVGMNSSETTNGLNLDNNNATQTEDLNYVWLWMSGCYDSIYISDSWRINIASGGIPKCLEHCNGSKHIALEVDTCICVSSNILSKSKKRHEKYCDKKCSFTDTEIRPCGGAGRYSLYTIAKEKVMYFDMNADEAELLKCASLQYSLTGYNLIARTCNTRKYALCKNYDEDDKENSTFSLKTSEERFSWRNAFYRACEKALAIGTGPAFLDNLQKVFDGQQAEVWIGLIREDIVTWEYNLDKGKNTQEADLLTKVTPSGQEWANTSSYSSGYFCSITEFNVLDKQKEVKAQTTKVIVFGIVAALTTIVLGVVIAVYFYLKRKHNSTRPDQRVEDIPVHQVDMYVAVNSNASIDQSAEEEQIIAGSQLDKAAAPVERSPHYEGLDTNVVSSMHEYDLIKHIVTPGANESQYQDLDNNALRHSHDYDVIKH